eukprot:scaffold4365_cov70-Phaeocystis_antarctica.AAC.4
MGKRSESGVFWAAPRSGSKAALQGPTVALLWSPERPSCASAWAPRAVDCPALLVPRRRVRAMLPCARRCGCRGAASRGQLPRPARTSSS